jgi:hypothetical protein
MEKYPDSRKEPSPEQLARAHDFLSTHIYINKSRHEYMRETLTRWNATGRRQGIPFWGRIFGDGQDMELGAPVAVNYMFLAHGESDPRSYGSIIISDVDVQAYVPDADSNQQVREPVRALDEPYSLQGVARAIELVEQNFADRTSEARIIAQVEERFLEGN